MKKKKKGERHLYTTKLYQSEDRPLRNTQEINLYPRKI